MRKQAEIKLGVIIFEIKADPETKADLEIKADSTPCFSNYARIQVPSARYPHPTTEPQPH